MEKKTPRYEPALKEVRFVNYSKNISLDNCSILTLSSDSKEKNFGHLQIHACKVDSGKVPVPITSETADHLRSMGVPSRLFCCKTKLPIKADAETNSASHNPLPDLVYTQVPASLEKSLRQTANIPPPTFALVPTQLTEQVPSKQRNPSPTSNAKQKAVLTQNVNGKNCNEKNLDPRPGTGK